MSEAPRIHVSEMRLTVNGRVQEVEVAHHWTLLRVLRDALDLTGAKMGCDRGECGACTVVLDGQPVYACQMLALQARGKEVVTVEGLADEEGLHPVQRGVFGRGRGAMRVLHAGVCDDCICFAD